MQLLDTKKVMQVDILNGYSSPGKNGHLLGTDQGGRDVLKYLVLGARNSLNIGVTITLIVEMIGIAFGLVAGYYGGLVDNIMMRFRFHDVVADVDVSHRYRFDHPEL